jgi:hypothetical protein
MPMPFSLMDAIVLVAVLFAAVFCVAWLARPDLRAWIERPKYRFQKDVQDYDRMRKGPRNESR